jgi:hypothetical protein
VTSRHSDVAESDLEILRDDDPALGDPPLGDPPLGDLAPTGGTEGEQRRRDEPGDGIVLAQAEGLTLVLRPSKVTPASARSVEHVPRTLRSATSILIAEPPALPDLDRTESAGAILLRWLMVIVPMTGVLGLAGVLRFWRLDQVGFNSDEAVYAGTAATMAGDLRLAGMFPVFRAHPLLFQTVVSLQHSSAAPEAGRILAAVLGVLTVVVTCMVGMRLYGPATGVIAALLLAAMPYHVVVTRQVLLDGPMTLLATMTLYCVVRYCGTPVLRWLVAAAAMMGLTILTKETSVILLGGLYAFFTLTPSVPIRLRHLLPAGLLMACIVGVFPLVTSRSGRATTGQSYLLWQLSRRSNHETLFYARVLPGAVGLAALLLAMAGLYLWRRQRSWRERLLVAWVVIPVAFFTLWPLKGFQYLLPVAPAVAVLAGRSIAALGTITRLRGRRLTRRAVIAVVALATTASLAVPAWGRVNPSTSGTFLAGTGGVPGGREAGEWLRDHAPANAQVLAIGPSLANILQYYGRRRTFGLSVSADPHQRNPAYEPVDNPDLWVRTGQVQYLVWDSYTAARTPFFAGQLRALADRYHAVAAYTATVRRRSGSGAVVTVPVVIVYQVWSP